MLNAPALIEQVQLIVKDPDFSDDDVLGYLNNAQMAVASAMLLPELSDGVAEIQTIIGDNKVPMPDDYHRHLYYAADLGRTDGELNIANNIAFFERDYGPLSVEDGGDVVAVCVHGSRDATLTTPKVPLLYYVRVPDEQRTLRLRYYRKPRPLQSQSNSYPDGSDRMEYDWALIYWTVAQMYLTIEEGVEGKYPNHTLYMNKYTANIMALNRLEHRNRPRKPIPRTHSRF